MKPVWHVGRVPGQGGGQTLREVVGGHGCQAPPLVTAAGQFDRPTGEHHPEQQPANQVETDPVLAHHSRLLSRGDRADQQGQEAGLQEEDVPLEVKECLACLQITGQSELV